MKLKILKNDNLGDLILAIPFIKLLEFSISPDNIEIYIKNKSFLEIKSIFNIKSTLKLFPERKNILQLVREFHIEKSINIDLVGSKFNYLISSINFNRSIGINRYNFKFCNYKFPLIPNCHEAVLYILFLEFLLKKLHVQSNYHINKVKSDINLFYKFHKINKLNIRNNNFKKPGYKYYIFHAGGHNHKRFKSIALEKLIRLLSKINITPLIIGTENEFHSSKNIVRIYSKFGVVSKNLAGKTTNLRELSYLIQNAEFYIGPDSGTAHLSGALGTKTIVYFGPTSSTRFSPIGENVFTFKSDKECTPCWEPQIKLDINDSKCLNEKFFNKLWSFLKEMQ